MKCTKCPRHCEINNKLNSRFCKVKNLKIALVSLHKFEEPIISGKNGSGTIFFSGCNLKCNFCQNYEISHQNKGKIISASKLVEIFKELENKGAENINLVTPTPHRFNIIKALKIYKPKVPVVYNCSGYEDIEIIKKLKGLVDIYLVDLKYYDDNLSSRLSKCNNYFSIASKVILEMVNQTGKPLIKDDMLKKGVIIRHLVLPNHTDDSIKLLDWIKENVNDNAIVSIMSQYLPCYKASEDINRKITLLEYKRVISYARKLDINGFCQELDSSNSCYIPNFNLTGF